MKKLKIAAIAFLFSTFACLPEAHADFFTGYLLGTWAADSDCQPQDWINFKIDEKILQGLIMHTSKTRVEIRANANKVRELIDHYKLFGVNVTKEDLGDWYTVDFQGIAYKETN